MPDRILTIQVPSKDRKSFEEERKSIESIKAHDNVEPYEECKLGDAVNGVHTAELKVKNDKTLADFIRERSADAKLDFANLAFHLCSGVDHLHNHNVIHGFITADNVTVTNERRPKLTGYGFLKWRHTETASKVEDMRALKRLCIFVATRGKYSDDVNLTAEDLVEVDDKSKQLALSFIHAFDTAVTTYLPSLAILLHPLLTISTEQARRRLRELTPYDELLEPFSKDELNKFKSEVDKDLLQDFSKLENIVTSSTRDLNKLTSFLDAGFKECPHLFAHFIWRAVPHIVQQPRIVLESPGSLSFSSAIKGTWHRGPEVIRVALKKGKWGTDTEPVALKKERFNKELEELRKIDYFFIVKFLGCVTKQSLQHLVTELCDGNLRMYCHKLIDNMNRGVIDEKVILGQLITGIGYLHSQGIVHGDIRPDSVLLWRHPRGIIIVKITNFGLSKAQPLDTSQYSTSTPLGSKGYIAPEILEVGDPEKVTKTFASDMWALGIVIYFTVSRGEHPFSYRNPSEPNNCRDEMLRKTKMLRNISKISEYWDSADLIYQLIDPKPENRPNIYTVLLHPLFSQCNETTKNYFAYQMGRIDSTIVPSITAESVTSWYQKQYHNEFKSISDSDLFHALVSKLKEDESKMDVDQTAQVADVADLSPGQSQIRNLMKFSPKLFPIYLWWLMISKKPSMDRCKELFFLTPMNYSMIYMSSRFFNELWLINGKEKNEFEIPKLATLSAALCRPVVSRVVLNGVKNIKDLRFEGATPLHMACRRRADSAELVQFLLSKGADPNAKDPKGVTPVEYARRNNHQPGLQNIFHN